MKTAETIVFDYIAENCQLGGYFRSLIEYVDTKTVVGWFVEKLFFGIHEDIEKELGEEDSKIVIDYYISHCF